MDSVQGPSEARPFASRCSQTSCGCLTTILAIGWGCVLPTAAATRSRRARIRKAFPFSTRHGKAFPNVIDLSYPDVIDLTYSNVTVTVRRT